MLLRDQFSFQTRQLGSYEVCRVSVVKPADQIESINPGFCWQTSIIRTPVAKPMATNSFQAAFHSDSGYENQTISLLQFKPTYTWHKVCKLAECSYPASAEKVPALFPRQPINDAIILEAG